MSGDDELDPFAEAKVPSEDTQARDEGARGHESTAEEEAGPPAHPAALASRELDLDALDELEATQLAAAPRDLLATLRSMKEMREGDPPTPPPAPSLDAVQVDELLLGFGDEDPSAALEVDFDPFSMPPEPADDEEARRFAASEDPEVTPLPGHDDDAAGAEADPPGDDEDPLNLEFDAELGDARQDLLALGDDADAPPDDGDTRAGDVPRMRSMPPMPPLARASPEGDAEDDGSRRFTVPPPSAFPSADALEPAQRGTEVPVSGSYDRLPPLGVFRSSRPPPAASFPLGEPEETDPPVARDAPEPLDVDDEVELRVTEDDAEVTRAPGERPAGEDDAELIGGDEELTGEDVVLTVEDDGDDDDDDDDASVDEVVLRADDGDADEPSTEGVVLTGDDDGDDDEDASTEGVVLTVDDDAPTEDVVLTVDDDDAPTEDVVLTVDDDDAPTEDVVLTVDDDDASTEDVVLTDDDDDASTEDVVLTVDDDDDDDDAERARPAGPPAASSPPPPPLEPFDDLAALAPPARSAPSVSPAGPDTGARTARRTVTDRKPRREERAFVGDDPATFARRAELLERLAGTRKEGRHRARLLASAAELHAQCGDGGRASALLKAAHEADPADLATLRAWRRAALERGAYEDAGRALEAETALPVSAADRAMAWALLAQLRFVRLGDLGGAREAAARALAVAPSVASALALAELHRAAGDPQAARVAQEQAASLWADGRGAAVLEGELGREAEREGLREAAADHYARAQRAAPEDLVAALGLARTAQGGDGARALLAVAEKVASARLAEALVRSAALRARHARDEAHATEAAGRLATSGRPASLAAAAAAAPSEARKEILARLARSSSGTERALALVRQAEERAEGGDLVAADDALREAALADESLDLTNVVREVLARRAGDPARLARAVEMESDEGGALEAAARLAAEAPGSALEEDWLDKAAEEGRTPFTIEEIRLDLAAGRGDDAALDAALRRRAERLPKDQHHGPLLALSERLEPEDAEALLFELARARPGDPLVGRSLSAHLFPRYAQAAAELWRGEADAAATSAPQRAALAASWAARAAGDEGAGAREALEQALALRPGHGPARWAWAEQLAARAGSGPGVIVEAEERLAELAFPALADDPRDVGTWLALAFARSLAKGEEADGRGTVGEAMTAALAAAEARASDDALLRALVADTPSVSPARRAALLRGLAAETTGAEAYRLELHAAQALEDAGRYDDAASVLRDLLEAVPAAQKATLDEALTRVELAGTGAHHVAARLRAAVPAAHGAAGDEARSREQDGDDAATEFPRARRDALARLAFFELHHGTAEAARGPLEALLEHAPNDLPSLRALERVAMEIGDDDALRDVEGRLALALAAVGPEGDGGTLALRDSESHARLAVRLLTQPKDASGDAADGLLLALAPRLLGDEAGGTGVASIASAWTLRRLVAAYRAAGDDEGTLRALLALANALDREPTERLAVVLEAAPLLADLRDPRQGAELLAGADPDHPFAAAVEAKLVGAAGDAAALADAASRAVEAARTAAQRLGHGYVAAQAWELAGKTDEALAAYRRCAALDVTYREVFPRLRALLEDRDDTETLAKLLAQRLDAGAEGETLVALHEAHAALRKRLGDLDGARESLAAALELEPDRPGALSERARLALRVGAHREAAEALIRYARLTRDRAELRWVFFTLGDIYDRHLPDVRRADAAFKRVLKLVPHDEEALGRLADLYERQEEWSAAVGVLSRLVALAAAPETRRPLALRLAEAHERRGDLRAAEQTLDEERRDDPTEPLVLAALADLYARQGAGAALSMHLGRAASDLRRALQERPEEAELWEALADVMDRRERPDGTRVVAATAQAFEAASLELASKNAEPRVPGAAAAAMDPEVVRALSPGLGEPTFALFRQLADALDKALPFDTRRAGTRKLGRDDPARLQARELAPTFGFADAQVLVAPGTRWAPVSASPPTVLLGESLSALPEGPRAFLLTRALAVLSLRLEAPLRTPADALELSLAGFVRQADPSYAPEGMDEAQLDDAGRRLLKAVPRRHRDALGPLAIEVVAAADFDPGELAARIHRLADRLALLVLGDVASALDALLALAGVPHGTGALRAAGLGEVPAARALLEFALDDLHLDARRHTGAERL